MVQMAVRSAAAIRHILGCQMNVPLIFEVIGYVGAGWGLRATVFAYASSTWPSTKGRIVASVLDVSVAGEGQRTEAPLIAYEYSVNERIFVRAQVDGGLDWSWSTSLAGISSASATLRQYPLDKEVSVFYWPMAPGVCCLRPGKYIGAAALIVVSLGIVVVAHHFEKARPLPDPIHASVAPGH
jgi:hypothetical protein